MAGALLGRVTVRVLVEVTVMVDSWGQDSPLEPVTVMVVMISVVTVDSQVLVSHCHELASSHS